MIPWNIVGSLFSSYFADRAAKKAEQAAAEFAEGVAFDPFNVSTSLGGVSFEDGEAFASLAPEIQQQFDDLIGQAQGFGDALGSFDPLDAQQEIFEQQQSLFAPAQEQDRLALENRLLQQGLLGSTTGALRSGALREAQGQQDLARQVAAFEQAQQTQRNLQQGQANALSGALNLSESVSGLFSTGSGLGAQASAAAQAGLAPLRDAQAARATGQAAMVKDVDFGGVGEFISGMFNSKPATSTPFTGSRNPHR